MNNEELTTQALTLKEKVTTLQVVDLTSYEQAGEMLKAIKAEIKKREDYFKPMKKAADDAKKVILDNEKAAINPLREADEILRRNVTTYLDAEEKKRKEAEAEAIRKAEADAEKEREKLLNRAANAKTEEKQEELLEKAENVYAAPVAVEHAVDKTVSGMTRKLDTVVTVLDVHAFVLALAQQYPGALRTIVDIKAGPLKTFAKANGLKKFPGLLIEEKAGISVRV